MERIDKVIEHPAFLEAMNTIEQEEENRVYCLHDMNHGLDVARISYIISLENNIKIKKDIIYAAALLHDIGRCLEYTHGRSHHTEGARLAREILSACDYSEVEINMICEAIMHHKRINEDGTATSLNNLLYRADKLSRRCYACKAIDDCYWSDNMKNKTITV